ncbi:MAG: 50S ribosomal protein L6 [Candidatus Yanofskybacteria bacterium RIFCSPHIGHO2_02_FULL_38_22b]|uniref:Large ribosomal subunit protein uL6 n=1 Tax=Candidatus Yanofskybacteria bacterium RIFCSPHIGHO2_02_FULL_38_22b TaxID=1802673 RepID=A0A1F8F1U0_9BACT|nr:MAG: 50S ribosomal protein L6 [Candidatus Yanofskybacteria bacterium RIFCSPHIGHO2_01_FULL_39_44]OGN07101.1 MAG: 50S ribosomal protein L6 [Candidatus Yanofskybacteria bacterium RIFCSPHIGHO2_02_FULL_38_22b]OGN19951.1 MAG: 50S ribosomal protein L6 [Candidatus Yanofskybacteria bacterium RIFCSPLOWO2_01_FULL_39_28]
MSKIGKKPIQVPKGVEVKINGNSVALKGSKGELKKDFDQTIDISMNGDEIVLKLKKETKDKKILALWGLTRSLIANMIIGVAEGFEKGLEFEGVGYKANVKGNDLELNLGYSHPITIKASSGISFKVEKNTIKVMGIDKELVGHVAALIRSKRLPEPYQGSGIKYKGEIIRRKAGKKAAATA